MISFQEVACFKKNKDASKIFSINISVVRWPNSIKSLPKHTHLNGQCSLHRAPFYMIYYIIKAVLHDVISLIIIKILHKSLNKADL